MAVHNELLVVQLLHLRWPSGSVWGELVLHLGQPVLIQQGRRSGRCVSLRLAWGKSLQATLGFLWFLVIYFIWQKVMSFDSPPPRSCCEIASIKPRHFVLLAE